MAAGFGLDGRTQELQAYSKDVTDNKYVHHSTFETRVDALEIRISKIETNHEQEDVAKLVDEKIKNAKLEIDNNWFVQRLAKADDRWKWGITTIIAIIAICVNIFNK